MQDAFSEFEGRESETVPEETVAEETTEETHTEVETPTETSPEAEVTSEEGYTEPEPELEETKTVPLEALHEEREKRKLLRSELDEIKTQNAEILQNYKRLAD